MLEAKEAKNGRKKQKKEVEMEQQELAIIPAENNAIYAMSKEEADEYSDIPITLPRMKFDGRKGTFTFSMDETTVKEIRVAIMAHKYNHVMFGELGADGPSWLCRSGDAISGNINPGITDEEKESLYYAGAGGACQACPMMQWHKGDKPKCSRGLNLLAVDLDTQMPYVVTAARSSLKGMESYLNSFRLNKTRPYSSATTITSERKTAKKGNMELEWYVMKPRRDEMLPPEMVKDLVEFKATLSQSFSNTAQAIAEDVPEEAKVAPVYNSEGVPFPTDDDLAF